MPDQFVRNYRRQAALGGPANPDGDAVSVRWFGLGKGDVLSATDFDELPASVTVRPALIEPVNIGRSDGAVAVGEVPAL